MIIFPAIDLMGGQCVRLVKGDYATASRVAEDPVETAQAFEAAGAEWIHLVDLDGAKAKQPRNRDTILDISRQTGLKTEVGGGIRDMEAVESYLAEGIDRVILGSAAISNPAFVREAAATYGGQIAVGIDARNEMASAEGWRDDSSIHYLDLARRMDEIGVSAIIYTDISRDGTLEGPNIHQLEMLRGAVSCEVIASGGVACIEDIALLRDSFLHGAVCGKALYSGNLDLSEAIETAAAPPNLSRFFKKGEFIPAIVQDEEDGQVLMLAYMNAESLRKTLETGYTWFFSRSRGELWNKGATSGHVQRVTSIRYDCDEDTLLIRAEQTGAACHTGERSCFYRQVYFRA